MDALDFAAIWTYWSDITWFPSSSQIHSNEMYVFPMTIIFRGDKRGETEIELFFVDPIKKVGYYFSAKT